MSLDRRRQMIEPDHPQLSVVRQCELVSISRSGFYHRPTGETPLNLELMRLIDAQFLETPWYGSRQMARHLRREGYTVGRKRIRRLMTKMSLAPIYQRPRTTVPNPEHRIFPYLLRDLTIEPLAESRGRVNFGLIGSEFRETSYPVCGTSAASAYSHGKNAGA